MNDFRWNMIFIGMLLFVAAIAAMLLDGDAAAYFAATIPQKP